MEPTKAIPNDVFPSLDAQSWMAKWSRQGAHLQFANSSLEAKFFLEPIELARLMSALSRELSGIESVGGILWNENHKELGQIADRRLDWQRYAPHSPNAQRIYSIVKNLPLTGFERSFKMAENNLSSERFIVGLPRNRIAVDDIDFVASQLGMPPQLKTALEGTLSQSEFVHFGYEGSSNSSNFKIYLEFPRRFEIGSPLYFGYKWNVADAGLSSVTEYRHVQLPDQFHAADLIRRYLDSEPLCMWLADIVNAAISRSALSDIMLLDVADLATQRFSFDLNVYSAGLMISDIASTLQSIGNHLGIDHSSLNAILSKAKTDELGHLSGGVDLNGRPFITVYHAYRPDR